MHSYSVLRHEATAIGRHRTNHEQSSGHKYSCDKGLCHGLPAHTGPMRRLLEQGTGAGHGDASTERNKKRRELYERFGGVREPMRKPIMLIIAVAAAVAANDRLLGGNDHPLGRNSRPLGRNSR